MCVCIYVSASPGGCPGQWVSGLSCFLAGVAKSTTDQHVLDHIACFDALRRIVETILRASRQKVEKGVVKRLVSLYLMSFKALYTDKAMIIKFPLFAPPCSPAGAMGPHSLS